MPNLMPSDIQDEVREILIKARDAKHSPCFLAAHQIVARLPEQTRQRLVEERGLGGHGSGDQYTAASVVSDAAEMVGAEVVWLDADGVRFQMADQDVTPGANKIALYRLTGNA